MLTVQMEECSPTCLEPPIYPTYDNGASECTDGNLGTYCHTTPNDNFAHAASLTLELESSQAVGAVYIWNRHDVQSRLAYYQVWVGDVSGALGTMCAQGDASSGPAVVYEACAGWGRYVTLRLPGPSRTLNNEPSRSLWP